PRLRLLLVRARRPGVGDAARVRGRRQVERGAAGLRVEAEAVAELGQPGTAAAPAAGPDSQHAVRLRDALRELLAELRLAHLDVLGAVAASLPDPEVDDRSPV